MNNLMKCFENEVNTFYSLNEQGLVTIPKELNNNIKVFVTFKDSINNEERPKLMKEMEEISKVINQAPSEGLYIVSVIDTKSLEQGNIFTYANEFDKVKKMVNAIYNKILGEGNLKKENFVKKVGLLNFSGKYTNFTNWLCQQEPNKFYIANYQQLRGSNLENTQSSVFTNQNSASIFNEPNIGSSMTAMQSNIRPIDESLVINTPNRIPQTSGQYINQNPQTFYNQKKLVKTLPNNNHKSPAFIKWYTLFVLIMSLAIGIGISIYLVK